MYVDYDGNEAITAAALITAAIVGAVIGGVTYVAINLYNGTAITWGGLTKSILVGAVSGAATCGIGAVAGSIFSNTATSFFQGALQGAVTGAITGTGGAFINAILNGDNPTLRAILQGALTGAVVGGIIGGIQGVQNGNKIYSACNKMGINPNDPVLATDEFLRQAQENWFPDAPMDKLKAFTVENPTASVKDFFAQNPKTLAVTTPISIGGKLTGNSRMFFNPNTAFTSAKTLYMAMGHEFVHVSQYATLTGVAYEFIRDNADFTHGLLEYHTYSFQHNVLGDDFQGTMFTPDVVREYMSKYPSFFESMNYRNFSWTNNTSFNYPFIKK